jgi:hypothetical protein
MKNRKHQRSEKRKIAHYDNVAQLEYGVMGYAPGIGKKSAKVNVRFAANSCILIALTIENKTAKRSVDSSPINLAPVIFCRVNFDGCCYYLSGPAICRCP